MSTEKKCLRPVLLVGDNPFHGISHLSQERSRLRGKAVVQDEYDANLVMTSINNGANGFMFSVSEKTLSILRIIHEREEINHLKLYALVPYAYEYVRVATQVGGISGLGKKLAKEIVLSGNLRAIATGLKSVTRMDPESLMKAYLMYEVSRIESAAGKQANLDSLMLHEIITDMAIALGLDWLFKAYIDFVSNLGVKPGFETRNFAYLVDRFKQWNIDFNDIIIATPFNSIGFQMNPSKEDCEKALASLRGPNVVAMSVLGAGYLKPSQAIGYLRGLPNLWGVVVGVSKEDHAISTFRLFEKELSRRAG
jgi:hypothetical protein